MKLGYACERQCLFCVQGDLRRLHPRPQPPDALAAALRDGRTRASTAVFTGGEPTLFPYLPDLVRLARLLGYTRVQIQSNGRRFADPAYCRALIAAGADEFALSVHGSTPAVHDALTGVPGSFARVWAGLANLLRLGRPVLTNTVVTRSNMAELPALAGLLTRAGVRHLQFAFLHIVGRAAEGADWLVPRKTEAVPHMLRAVAAARAAGAQAFTEGVPPCLLRGVSDCAAEAGMPAMDVRHADGTACVDFSRERREVQKSKGPRCPECAWFRSCEGPWREYPERFGWGEFVPVAAR